MKNLFGAALIGGSLLAVGSASAQYVNVQDFETGSDGTALAVTWLPSTSGTSTGNVVVGSTTATISTAQAQSGTRSGKLGWTWLATSTNPPKRVRIQPGVNGFISANNQAVDRSSTPFVGFYLFGAAQGDGVALYMGEANNGGSPYEAFSTEYITWTGWKLYERNISDPVTAFLTGNGTLPATNAISGLVFYPPADNAATNAAVTYFVDDFGYSAASRTAGVDNWSVY